MKKPFVLCVVATRRHVGKTTVLTRILKEMKNRKLTVGTVKHIAESLPIDLPADKDTTKHLEAGSQITSAVTTSEIITVRRDIPPTLDSALSQMPKKLDYILVEGFRHSRFPKIVVVASRSEEIHDISGDIIAVTVDQKEILERGATDQTKQFNDGYLIDLIQEFFQARR